MGSFGAVACAKKQGTSVPASDSKVRPTGGAEEGGGAAPGGGGGAQDIRNRPVILLRGGRLLTATGKIYERGDILLREGTIAEIGEHIVAPAGAQVFDIAGKTVTPGLVDTHSHMGVYAAPGFKAHADGNEAVSPNTAYARSVDGYWPQDPQLERARAGGVTTAQILPGSANLIGGRSFVVHLIPWARSAEDARFPGAPEGLKMACGENPKRVYGEKSGPQTRMGNVHGYRDAFQKAVEYRRSWAKYEKAKKDSAKAGKKNLGGDKGAGDGSKEPPVAPARDFALETLAKVLDGEILVHNHCYRADEMSLMLDLAATYGFKIRSFHHAIEAYKIADRLAEAGTAASVWADWWGFKAEAFDGVRENAALIEAAGARAIIHSDSAIGIQHLNQEAAKAMYAGRNAGLEVSEDTALRWITKNPAWALGLEERIGTLEAGKIADLVVWSGSPFSVYTAAERVYIAGELVYQQGVLEPRSDFEIGFRDGDLSGDPEGVSP
ncbi:MAG TPA: amidohydrolase [Nannocystis exedens]|nr:amidohydrolase [Nannocystis exedens]